MVTRRVGGWGVGKLNKGGQLYGDGWYLYFRW